MHKKGKWECYLYFFPQRKLEIKIYFLLPKVLWEIKQELALVRGQTWTRVWNEKNGQKCSYSQRSSPNIKLRQITLDLNSGGFSLITTIVMQNLNRRAENCRASKIICIHINCYFKSYFWFDTKQSYTNKLLWWEITICHHVSSASCRWRNKYHYVTLA